MASRVTKKVVRRKIFELRNILKEYIRENTEDDIQTELQILRHMGGQVIQELEREVI